MNVAYNSQELHTSWALSSPVIAQALRVASQNQFDSEATSRSVQYDAIKQLETVAVDSVHGLPTMYKKAQLTQRERATAVHV